MAINLNELKPKNTQQEKKKQESPLMDFLRRDISFGKAFPDKKKQWLFGELGLLLNAGVDIKNALDMIVEEQSRDKKMAPLFHSLREAIMAGDSISEALEKSGKFSQYDRFTVRIGEETGQLPPVLLQLAGYYEQRMKLRRQLTSALSYPSLVMAAAVGAIAFLINFLIPMFEDVFKRFSGELPLITRKIIAFSNFMSNNSIFILLFIAAVVALYLFVRKMEAWRSFASAFTIKIPLMGTIYKNNHLARFCQALEMLLNARVPLTEALKLTKDIVGFYPLEKAIPLILQQIEHGSSLSAAMKPFPVFDSRMIYLVRVAEEVNQLDGIFKQLQQFYASDVEHKVTVMGSVLEPLLIIVVGALVGIILVAMYLPLFQISNSFM